MAPKQWHRCGCCDSRHYCSWFPFTSSSRHRRSHLTLTLSFIYFYCVVVYAKRLYEIRLWWWLAVGGRRHGDCVAEFDMDRQSWRNSLDFCLVIWTCGLDFFAEKLCGPAACVHGLWGGISAPCNNSILKSISGFSKQITYKPFIKLCAGILWWTLNNHTVFPVWSQPSGLAKGLDGVFSKIRKGLKWTVMWGFGRCWMSLSKN